MRDAGIVSEDLARNLRIETENVHASRRPMATVDMRATTPELLCGFPVFKDLDDAELKRVAKRLQERVFGPDAFVFRLGDRVAGDRKSGVSGWSVSVRVYLGGSGIIKHTKNQY